MKAIDQYLEQIEREIKRYFGSDTANLPRDGTAEEACKSDLPQE